MPLDLSGLQAGAAQGLLELRVLQRGGRSMCVPGILDANTILVGRS